MMDSPVVSYMDADAIEVALHIPHPNRVEFLTSRLEPALRQLRENGSLRAWYHWIGDDVYFHLWPARNSSQALLLEMFQSVLADPLREAGGRLRTDALPTMPPAALWKRYGGARGVRVACLFKIVTAPLSLRVLTLLNEPSRRESAFEVGFALFFYLTETLNLRGERLVPAVSRWASFFGTILSERDLKIPVVVAQQAQTLLGTAPGLAKLVDAGVAGGWRQVASARLVELLSPYEKNVRRVGQLLETNTEFVAEYPREHVILHSYVHSVFLNVGCAGLKELLLYEVLKARLES